MLSSAPSIGARQCLRLHPRSSASAARASAVTARSLRPSVVCQRAGASNATQQLHSAVRRNQAVEVAHRPQAASPSPVGASGSLAHIAERAQSIMDPGQQILGSQWSNRVDALIRKTQAAEAVGAHGHVRNRVTLVGSFHSQTQQLLSAMIDEPLREISAIEGNEAEAVLTALRTSSPSKPFTISYAPGPPQALEGSGITLDRHWLQQANMQITVLINPTLSEETYDVIYDSEAVVFVTDDYALSRAAHRSAGQRGDTTHELLSRFAAKPNVHLVVNSILGTDPAHFANALESATGASVSDLVAPHLIPVRVSDALAANAALRQALDKQDQQPLPIVAPRTSTAYWDNFSSHYQRSNVGTVLHLIQHLDTLHGSHTLLAHSSAFLLQHCLDEALATTKHNLATLHQLRSLAVETDARNSATLKQSLERIWPPAAAYTGQLSSDEIQVWRPAAPGSSSAVESAMQMTDDLIERTFDTKLQWWKLVWKVDDVRKELETACAGFAASLESDLAYESGRLATLQVSKVREADALLVRFRDLAQKLGSTIEDAKRDAAMVVNEAEGYRSSRLRTIEPSTLMAPIHVRRAQLLETGGPIDALALKSRKLAVTSSAAVAVTAAGVGSASVLGSSLGLVDASAAALALDPATGMGLGLLTLTLVGWRMQGQYNKFRRRFRQDWLRLSEGLDQDLKGNFEEVLRGQIVGPSEVVASRVRELARSWGAKIQQQEAHVRAVARQTPAPLSTSQEVTQDITPRAST